MDAATGEEARGGEEEERASLDAATGEEARGGEEEDKLERATLAHVKASLATTALELTALMTREDEEFQARARQQQDARQQHEAGQQQEASQQGQSKVGEQIELKMNFMSLALAWVARKTMCDEQQEAQGSVPAVVWRAHVPTGMPPAQARAYGIHFATIQLSRSQGRQGRPQPAVTLEFLKEQTRHPNAKPLELSRQLEVLAWHVWRTRPSAVDHGGVAPTLLALAWRRANLEQACMRIRVNSHGGVVDGGVNTFFCAGYYPYTVADVGTGMEGFWDFAVAAGIRNAALRKKSDRAQGCELPPEFYLLVPGASAPALSCLRARSDVVVAWDSAPPGPPPPPMGPRSRAQLSTAQALRPAL